MNTIAKCDVVCKFSKSIKDKAIPKTIRLHDTDGQVRAIGVTKKGYCDAFNMDAATFAKQYVELDWGHEPYPAERAAEELVMTPGMKFSEAACMNIERILKMDTRGKSTEQVRQEMERIAVDLPKGHALRNVPKSYPDRGTAIAAYTALRQALFALNPEMKGSDMGSKKVVAAKEEVKAEVAAETKAKGKAAAKAEAKPEAGKGKATPAAKDLVAGAEKKGRAPKADFTGNYVSDGEAAKVKTTEELGMHEGSVRTSLLSVIMASKSAKGVDYAKLEATAGDKTRGALAYLVKRGFIKRV